MQRASLLLLLSSGPPSSARAWRQLLAACASRPAQPVTTLRRAFSHESNAGADGAAPHPPLPPRSTAPRGADAAPPPPYVPKRPAQSFFGSRSTQAAEAIARAVAPGEPAVAAAAAPGSSSASVDAAAAADEDAFGQRATAAAVSAERPLARREDIAAISAARQRQRRPIVPSAAALGSDGKMRVPRSAKEAGRLDSRLEPPSNATGAATVRGLSPEAARFAKMSQEKIQELSQQYQSERGQLTSIEDGGYNQAKAEEFEKQWAPFEEYMRSTGSPLSLETMSPKLQAIIRNQRDQVGPMMPALHFTHVGMRDPAENFSRPFGTSPYERPISDEVAAKRSILANLVNLTPRQREQMRGVLSDFDAFDLQYAMHVLKTYPYAYYLFCLLTGVLTFALFKWQLYSDAYGFYDEFLGLDFRRVPQFERPVIGVLTVVGVVGFCGPPLAVSTIVLQRMYRILCGRPVGPP